MADEVESRAREFRPGPGSVRPAVSRVPAVVTRWPPRTRLIRPVFALRFVSLDLG